MTPQAIAETCGGEVLRGGRAAKSVVTDSREYCHGNCFFALNGADRDGHRFVGAALRKGAVGAVVGSEIPLRLPNETFLVRVPDPGKALLELAAEHRRRHAAKVIGITGSCGKTSTKDMLGKVLAAAMPTVSSLRSYNNHIGVPLTLFRIRPETWAVVVEIGSNSPGEVAALTAVSRPDVAIVTCVGQAHLDGFGSLVGVAKEKSCLVSGLRPGGVAILNGDDTSCQEMARSAHVRTVLVRIDREADWFATDVRFHGLGTTFLLRGQRRVTLPRLGSHNVYNALLTLAAAKELGVDEDRVLAVLARTLPSQRRLDYRQVGGVTIFDDTYNMNPDSARAALEALSGLQGGRRIVVFGEMLELGVRAEELHSELGGLVASLGIDRLVCVGSGASAIADGALTSDMPASAVHRTPDSMAAQEVLSEILRPGDMVLCKASRGIALDRLVDAIVEELERPGSTMDSGGEREEACSTNC
jgi:UDP-N-acetylmuramoyl-tripeptide--D-alanyl-D-alanine ligase